MDDSISNADSRNEAVELGHTWFSWRSFFLVAISAVAYFDIEPAVAALVNHALPDLARHLPRSVSSLPANIVLLVLCLGAYNGATASDVPQWLRPWVNGIALVGTIALLCAMISSGILLVDHLPTL